MSDPSDIGSDIASFYRGRSILITGGTGLMGKVLVEKLLRACPGIENIYLLMRPKKGNDVNTRLMELINTTVSKSRHSLQYRRNNLDKMVQSCAPVLFQIFDGLRKENAETLNKLVPVAGDITAPGLGLSQVDCKVLTEKVSVVFHSAATVKFDESLKESVAMNMSGTKSVVQLCQKMENLAVRP